MLDHNLAIVVTEIPLETRKRESQPPRLPPPVYQAASRLLGQDSQLWEFIFKEGLEGVVWE